MKQIHSLSSLKEIRASLRDNLTPAEAALWQCLKGRSLNGRKFIRQHSIGPYIVDFYCPAERLIIELDGQVHFNPVAARTDEERDKSLTDMGYKVLRFENRLVFEDSEAVLAEISSYFK